MQIELSRRVVQLCIAILALIALSMLGTYYVDWLWFESIGYNSVFLTMLFSEWAVYLTVFAFSFLLIAYNLDYARKNMPPSGDDSRAYEQEDDVIYLHPVASPWTRFMEGPLMRWSLLGLALVSAFLLSASTGSEWLTVQQYLHKQPFGITDSLFYQDLSFYFFDLKFYTLVYDILMAILVMTLTLVAGLHLLNAGRSLAVASFVRHSSGKSHMSALLALIILLKAWGYKLETYGLLFDHNGIVFGATYTDISARLVAFNIMIAVAVATCLFIALSIYKKRFTWVVYAFGAWLLLALSLNSVYPFLMQKFVVQPNEFNMEKPYIMEAIKSTRVAYNLDGIETREFDIKYNLDAQKLEDNRLIVDNIRLWDWQPLKSTYKSLQELRLYYVFNDIDIDRYLIDGKKRQVMLSAREMEEMDRNASLPAEAKTWVNQRLMYTHGYGVVMSPVTEVAQEGFPQFFIKDIPPQSSVDIEVKQPQIYFGESTDSYVIVNGIQKEFDYPLGDTNMYTNYSGTNGLLVNSFARRLLFAWELADYKLILATDITNDSQILMNRNIMDRVEKLAPYLSYDSDPYIVINKDDGKLYWMLDAYTVSNHFPYSQPYRDSGENYIRNSVKLTIDAYSGEVNFYIADAADPIIRTYEQIFPGMYKDIKDMPAGLKSHIRYPVDMFAIQSRIYGTFHMQDPWVFYNKEDSWIFANEIADNKEKNMEPYYIIMRLPGALEPEYILMLPYTPNGRPNMIAWMCVRMDNDEYGQILVYTFPKKETVYGPMQIESRINQNTEISKQLTLWDQKGSSVYRGNLLVIPIGESLLYIEPLYLQAASSQMPEMKRVIAAYEDNIVMEESLAKCLQRLFGYPAPDGSTVAPGVQEPDNGVVIDSGTDLMALVEQASQYYQAADQAARNGDWAAYGDNLDKLGKALDDMKVQLNQP